MDVLSGRGAAVNNHPGNKKFRALCFVRKRHFDIGNHAVKRSLAVEIVNIMLAHTPSTQWLKKRPPMTIEGLEGGGGGGDDQQQQQKQNTPLYFAMTKEQAILKAQQVMRDYKRPDRIEAKEQQHQNRRDSESEVEISMNMNTIPSQPMSLEAIAAAASEGQERAAAAAADAVVGVLVDSSVPTTPAAAAALSTQDQSQSQSRRRSSTSGTKRTRTSVSTPIDGVVDKLNEPDPINDELFQVNPFGVHAHDVLSGRG